jgi:archaellum component FlaC
MAKNDDAPVTRKDMGELRASVRKDIDEVLDVMRAFMKQVDDRFNKTEAWQRKTEAWQFSMEDRFDELKAEIQELRAEFRRFQDSVDGLAKWIADDDQERAAMGLQLNRLDRQLHELAAKAGITLSSADR